VIQHQHELLDLAAHDGRNLTDEEKKRLLWFCKFLSPNDAPEDTASWLRQHMYFFDSVDAWRRFLRNYSGSINTRIHGTLMTLSAGLPAVCLYHDSRTKELAETMLVPSLLHTAINESKMTARDIFDATPINGAAFDDNRRRTAQIYRRALAGVGLAPSRHLALLAEGAA
jgi:hypothetical protein